MIFFLIFRLDKGNLGNAKTSSKFEKDLGLEGNQYNTLLSVFYVPYVLCAPPFGMLSKKYGPARVLPLMMFTFGSMTLISSGVHNFGGIMAGMFSIPTPPYPVQMTDRDANSEMDPGNGRECIFPLGHLLSHDFLQTW